MILEPSLPPMMDVPQLQRHLVSAFTGVKVFQNWFLCEGTFILITFKNNTTSSLNLCWKITLLHSSLQPMNTVIVLTHMSLISWTYTSIMSHAAHSLATYQTKWEELAWNWQKMARDFDNCEKLQKSFGPLKCFSLGSITLRLTVYPIYPQSCFRGFPNTNTVV